MHSLHIVARRSAVESFLAFGPRRKIVRFGRNGIWKRGAETNHDDGASCHFERRATLDVVALWIAFGALATTWLVCFIGCLR